MILKAQMQTVGTRQ